jgi:hypothetical protein
MVPRKGLEPPQPYDRQHLKLVRLPISPPGHGSIIWVWAFLGFLNPILAFSLQTWWFDTVALFITKIDISRYIDRACIAKGIKCVKQKT